MSVDISVGLQLLFEPVSYAAVDEHGTSGLAIEVFDDLDKVCADVALLHVAHKATCQTLSKAF